MRSGNYVQWGTMLPNHQAITKQDLAKTSDSPGRPHTVGDYNEQSRESIAPRAVAYRDFHEWSKFWTSLKSM